MPASAAAATARSTVGSPGRSTAQPGTSIRDSATRTTSGRSRSMAAEAPRPHPRARPQLAHPRPRQPPRQDPSISGRVTAKGANAAGVVVQLLGCTPNCTLLTLPPPAAMAPMLSPIWRPPAPGESYRVRYVNGSSGGNAWNPNYLAWWVTKPITAVSDAGRDGERQSRHRRCGADSATQLLFRLPTRQLLLAGPRHRHRPLCLVPRLSGHGCMLDCANGGNERNARSDSSDELRPLRLYGLRLVRLRDGRLQFQQRLRVVRLLSHRHIHRSARGTRTAAAGQSPTSATKCAPSSPPG